MNESDKVVLGVELRMTHGEFLTNLQKIVGATNAYDTATKELAKSVDATERAEGKLSKAEAAHIRRLDTLAAKANVEIQRTKANESATARLAQAKFNLGQKESNLSRAIDLQNAKKATAATLDSRAAKNLERATIAERTAALQVTKSNNSKLRAIELRIKSENAIKKETLALERQSLALTKQQQKLAAMASGGGSRGGGFLGLLGGGAHGLMGLAGKGGMYGMAAMGGYMATDAAMTRGFQGANLAKNIPWGIQGAQDRAGGLISKMDLMKAASMQSAMGLNVSQAQFETMAGGALMSGKRLGKDPGELIQNLITGMSRLSPRLLDNLGIVLRLDETYKKYATSVLGVNRELTAQEKQQAVVYESMRQLEEQQRTGVLSLDSAGAGWLRLKVSIDDAITSFTSGLSESEALGLALKTVAVSVDGVMAALSVLGSIGGGLLNGIAIGVKEGVAAAWSGFVSSIDSTPAAIDMVGESVDRLAGKLNKNKGAWDSFTDWGSHVLGTYGEFFGSSLWNGEAGKGIKTGILRGVSGVAEISNYLNSTSAGGAGGYGAKAGLMYGEQPGARMIGGRENGFSAMNGALLKAAHSLEVATFTPKIIKDAMAEVRKKAKPWVLSLPINQAKVLQAIIGGGLPGAGGAGLGFGYRSFPGGGGGEFGIGQDQFALEAIMSQLFNPAQPKKKRTRGRRKKFKMDWSGMDMGQLTSQAGFGSALYNGMDLGERWQPQYDYEKSVADEKFWNKQRKNMAEAMRELERERDANVGKDARTRRRSLSDQFYSSYSGRSGLGDMVGGMDKDEEGKWLERINSMKQSMGGMGNGVMELLGGMTNAATGFGGALSGAFMDAVAAGESFTKGLKQGVHEVLLALAKEFMVRSIAEGAFGLAALAIGGPIMGVSAAAHGAAAAGFAAAAALAGAGARATFTPTAPTRSKADRGLGGAGYAPQQMSPATVTLNINSLVATADEDQFARAIGNGLRLARARGLA